jgi:zinc finger protein
MERIEKQQCPFCNEKTLTLIEDELEIPYFGKAAVFSMFCSSCGAKQSDVESIAPKEPAKYEFTIENKKDLEVRVVRSSEGKISLPGLRVTVEPGNSAEGFISNTEGIIQRVKKIIEGQRDGSDDPAVKKKAKNLLKKIWKIECGDEKLKIVIEDPTGNSAIISDKAIVTKLKKKK